jgi:diaminopimelate epimerase
MRVRFEKWEGLGNDFVVIRDLDVPLDDAAVKRICDRRFGVGGDGVLLVETRGRAMPRMIVRNADGSRPEMCGNGLRCVAGHLSPWGTLAGSPKPPRGESGTIVVETDAGERRCEISPTGDGRVEVLVDMGVARPGPDLLAAVGGREHRFLTMDMGNPHAVSFEEDPGALDVLGPAVATLPPGGTNVELCRVTEGRIVVAVWERGVGRTLACGTGACAVAAVACDTGRARFDVPVTVELPGGPLEITVATGSRAVRMRGPARRVFTGEMVLT